MLDLSRIETLRQKLAQERDLEKIFTYFLDHFGENPDFIALGEPTENPFLESIFVQIGEALFKKEVKVRDLRLIRIPELNFIHGGGVLGGRLANVLYFEDMQQGVLYVITSLSPMKGHLCRFTAKMMQEPNNHFVH
jgi:hypothetical protein